MDPSLMVDIAAWPSKENPLPPPESVNSAKMWLGFEMVPDSMTIRENGDGTWTVECQIRAKSDHPSEAKD